MRPSFRHIAASRFLISTLLAGAVAGCSTLDRDWDRPLGKPYKPGNYVSAGPIPSSVRRVGVLPIHSKTWTATDLAALELAFGAELGKVERFETMPIAREALAARFQKASFLSSASLPAEFLGRLRADFGLDAILFLDLTHYSPYQPISIGVRSKLVSLHDGGILWSIDSVFDSSQPNVAIAARQYHEDRSRPAYPLENTSGILQSPARYAKYVANAVFETLPARERE